LAVFFVQSFIAIATHSSTWDETHYFGIGKYLLKHQSWDVKGAIIHPPLSYYMSSLPLLMFRGDETLWQHDSKDINYLGSADLVRGQTILSSKANDGDLLLILSRIPFALLGVILGYYVFLFSKDIFGEKAAVVSLFFYAFCPNIIGLSSIALPDFPFAAFFFIFIFYLWRSLKEANISNPLLAGLALGLALLSKIPSLILFPLAIFLSALPSTVPWRKILSALGIIFSIAIGVLLSGYGFDLTPYFQGIELQFQGLRMADKFLLGENSTVGWWYYYFIDFGLKTSIPVLVMTVIALTILLKRRDQSLRDGMFLIIPIIVLFVIFSANRSSLGIRYILPVYPLIYVLIGIVAVSGKSFRLLTFVLGGWVAVSSLCVAPHYLSYFNEISGGPGNGYKYVLDSDLGQDLKELKKYLDKHEIDRISFSFFGTDSPQRYGIVYDWLPSFFLYNPNYASGLKDGDMCQNRFLAVSSANLYGTHLDNKQMFRWLLQYKPVAKIGYNIFVYDLANLVEQQ